MKSLLSVLFLSTFFILSCQSSSKKSVDPATFDPSQQNLRHGFTVFTGPKRTLIGVNDTDSIEKGRKLFERHCSSCHGENGKGDGPVAQKLGLKPANLAAMARSFPNHYLVIQINQGRGDMPVWQDMLSSEQVWNLSNYIQTLQTKKSK
ncbi:MAG: cytochrome c [Bdellovibrionales bacterium]|nr:cytochrome c [Bdellovibrionales bacterium]